MPDRRERTGQTLFMALVWVMTIAAVIGVGVLLGRYVLSYYASWPGPRQSSPAPSRSDAVNGSVQSGVPESPPVSGPARSDGGATAPAVPETTGQRPSGEAPEIARPEAVSILYRVQVGSFYERSEAESVARRLDSAGYPGFVTSGTPHRVQVGAFQDKANAERLASELELMGYSVVVQR